MSANVRPIKDYPPYTWREKQLKPRSKTWIKQVRESHSIEPYGDTIDEFVKRFNNIVAERGLEDAVLEMETDYGSYGDRDRDALYVKGWRDATEQEIAAVEAEAKQQREQAEVWRLRKIEEAKQLMKENPELFE
jgi:hypothetical protein